MQSLSFHPPSMTNFADISHSRIDSLKALIQGVQNTLLIPGLKPAHWQNQQQNSNCDAPIPSLNLPLPDDVDHAFSDLTLSPQLLAELNGRYRQGLQQIQQLHRQKFEQSCQELFRIPGASNTRPLPLLMADLRSVYESTYMSRYLPMMKNQILDLRSKLTLASGSKKIPFHAEYTPLLEKYFALNAYPSAPDRQILAKKTTMTPRQIEVWFQNHRKRAKENGRPVNRMPPNVSHNFSRSVEKSVSMPITKGIRNQLDLKRMPDEEDGHKSTEIVNESYASDLDTKSRVFPSRFSHSKAIYNLRSDCTFTFPSPIWSRKPSSQPISQSDINFSDFIATFAAKLSIREGPSKSKRKSTFRSQNQESWFFATTTVPCCAPHPAFIRNAQPSIPTQASRASFSLTTLLPSSPQIPAAANLPTSGKQPRSLRKAPPFPKRHPSNFHPYSHVSLSTPRRTLGDHDVGSMTLFGSSASAMKLMPSRASNSMRTDSTSQPVNWVAALDPLSPSASRPTTLEPPLASPVRETMHVQEPPPESMATPIVTASFSTNRVASLESTASFGSTVSSIDLDSSFGSRTSSLSSLESPFPASPTLQPQTDDPLFLGHHDLQFLGNMSDFDRLMMGNTQLPFYDNVLTPKSDAILGFAFPYLHNTLASFPMNFMQTLS